MSSLSIILTAAMFGLPPEPKTPKTATPPAQPGRQAIEQALGFLEHDALKWKKERQCATCHHGTMTVWALREARHHGYPVNPETLAELLRWTKARFVTADLAKARDQRPGYNLVNLAAVYHAVMAPSVPLAGILTDEERQQIAAHVARHQETDGSWATPPPRNGNPPFFESAETNTLLAYLALEVPESEAGKAPSPIQDSREKATVWLNKTKPGDSTQATVLRLLVQVRAGKSAKEIQAGIDQLLARQNADGGWSQVGDIPSDAYATGQALYMLSAAGVVPDRMEVQHGVAFLIARQKADGSWPMTSRTQPGVDKKSANPVPISYLGSAWATLGLMRSVPK